MEDKKIQIKEFIDKIEGRDFDMYFFAIDTKGNPTAGIANIYEHVKLLTENGYRAHILHESTDYTKVGDWMGEEYDVLPHICIKSNELKIKAVDFLFIPELFHTLMEQCKNFPCKKIVFSQNYSYALEGLPIGKKWDSSYNFKDVLTTNERQADFIKDLFPKITTHIIPVSIPDYIKQTDELQEPIVLLSSRDQNSALRVIKMFYLKYPRYNWISFKELRNIPRTSLHKELSKGCVTVWIDEMSSFGTIPLESMSCGTPVIGVIPKIVPEWMINQGDENSIASISNNGVWSDNELDVPDLIANYLDAWLEDNLPENLNAENLKKVSDKYSETNQKLVLNNVYSNMINSRLEEFKTISLQYE